MNYTVGFWAAVGATCIWGILMVLLFLGLGFPALTLDDVKTLIYAGLVVFVFCFYIFSIL